MRADRFIECARRARLRKYDDNLESFLQRGSYADLVQTLDAFGRPFETRVEA
jgi:hypothetical protein